MPGADKPVPLSLVEDAVLYSGYTEGWSTRRRGVLEAALRRQDWFHPDTGRRGRIGESDVTALLSAAEGDLETALVEFFLGDLPSSDGGTVRVLSGSQVRKRYRRKGDHRVPDMFVARVADDDAIQPLVLIEAKGRAWVNGGRGYCAKDAETYSNQAICYPHLCWADESIENDWPQPAFVWLGHRSYQTGTEPWGDRGVTDADAARDPGTFASPLEEQRKSAARWVARTWEDLVDHLVDSTAARQATARAVTGVADIIRWWARIEPPAEAPKPLTADSEEDQQDAPVREKFGTAL